MASRKVESRVPGVWRTYEVIIGNGNIVIVVQREQLSSDCPGNSVPLVVVVVARPRYSVLARGAGASFEPK
jgi:hypothetical protein